MLPSFAVLLTCVCTFSGEVYGSTETKDVPLITRLLKEVENLKLEQAKTNGKFEKLEQELLDLRKEQVHWEEHRQQMEETTKECKSLLHKRSFSNKFGKEDQLTAPKEKPNTGDQSPANVHKDNGSGGDKGSSKGSQHSRIIERGVRTPTHSVINSNTTTASTDNTVTKQLCIDLYPNCRDLAMRYYCSNALYKDYMTQNCNSSCQLCTTKTHPTVIPLPTNKVAFYADMTTDLSTMGRLHTIVFDNVKTNIGNGYNKNTGLFTAPIAGTYVFSWYVMTPPSHYEELDIVVDGHDFAKIYSTNQDYDSASKNVVMNLQQGNEVWIRRALNNGEGFLTGHNYSSFTGWLLYPGA